MPCIRPGVEVTTAAPLHHTPVDKNIGLPKIRFIKGTEGSCESCCPGGKAWHVPGREEGVSTTCKKKQGQT